ncbi:hypothetical protein MMC32_007818 [Xylographa parallela]|nr:hypothetical protein [Xylographa parallela]
MARVEEAKVRVQLQPYWVVKKLRGSAGDTISDSEDFGWDPNPRPLSDAEMGEAAAVQTTGIVTQKPTDSDQDQGQSAQNANVEPAKWIVLLNETIYVETPTPNFTVVNNRKKKLQEQKQRLMSTPNVIKPGDTLMRAWLDGRSKAETRRAAASNNELEILLLESEDELCENGESNTSTVAQTTSDKSLDRRNGRERRQSQKQTENVTNLP